MKVSRRACAAWARACPPAEPIEWTLARERARALDERNEQVRLNDEFYASFSLVDYEENLIQTQTDDTKQNPKRTLFEIVDAVQQIMARVDDADGEIDEETAAELDALSLSLEEKAEAYATVYRMRREEADACDRMAKHYAERAARKNRQGDSLKRRLYEGMQAMGRHKIETKTATAYIQKSPPAVELLVPDEEMPAQYIELRRVVRKDRLKEDLQAGVPLTCARLSVGTHLRIR